MKNNSGFIGINKPRGISSAKVVATVKNILKTNAIFAKVGHMGTLDVDAEGVLVLAIGKATRLFDYYLDKQKTYVSTFKFGIKTNTDDTTGVVLETSSVIPSTKQIIDAMEKLKKQTLQTPPQFCANSVGGVRAYNLAREGKQVELQPKKIQIFDFKILENISSNEVKFLITCSSGTYIRAICRDLSILCGTYGATSSIIRVKSGFFELNNCVEFKNLSLQIIEKNIKPFYEVLSHIPQIDMPNDSYNKLANGLKISTELSNGNYFINKKMLVSVIDGTMKQQVILEEENG